MKNLINTAGNLIVNTFITVLGTFVASSICYTFYIIIAIIIILSIILPLIFLYFFNQPLVHSIFSPDTTESTLLDLSSETLKDTVETINTVSNK